MNEREDFVLHVDGNRADEQSKGGEQGGKGGRAASESARRNGVMNRARRRSVSKEAVPGLRAGI